MHGNFQHFGVVGFRKRERGREKVHEFEDTLDHSSGDYFVILLFGFKFNAVHLKTSLWLAPDDDVERIVFENYLPTIFRRLIHLHQ